MGVDVYVKCEEGSSPESSEMTRREEKVGDLGH